ncbi:MAG TPA: hypothetical protein EYN79_05725 [Planctomycetes bacterium]|nr:hypothetical protein [Planctomycetota bacterium]HIN80805.1 hypothetical protein [Planctomycetota bacterium]
MRTIDIDDSGAFGQIIDELENDAVLIQLPPVYVLVATATSAGVGHLDRLKIRQPNKNYGTMMGDIDRFWQNVDTSLLPEGFRTPEAIEEMSDLFFRCPFTDPSFHSSVIRNGTHQSLALDGVHRQLVCEIEAAFEDRAEPEMWAGKHFTAPIATSCNLSGDPLGSIVDEARALDFAASRGVGLFVTGEAGVGELGSYPILALEEDRVSIQREGPGLSRLLDQVRCAMIGDRSAA